MGRTLTLFVIITAGFYILRLVALSLLAGAVYSQPPDDRFFGQHTGAVLFVSESCLGLAIGATVWWLILRRFNLGLAALGFRIL